MPSKSVSSMGSTKAISTTWVPRCSLSRDRDRIRQLRDTVLIRRHLIRPNESRIREQGSLGSKVVGSGHQPRKFFHHAEFHFNFLDRLAKLLNLRHFQVAEKRSGTCEVGHLFWPETHDAARGGIDGHWIVTKNQYAGLLRRALNRAVALHAND